MVNYGFILLRTFIIVCEDNWAIKFLTLNGVIIHPVPLIMNVRHQRVDQECDS